MNVCVNTASEKLSSPFLRRRSNTLTVLAPECGIQTLCAAECLYSLFHCAITNILAKKIRRLKNSLGNKTGDEAHDKKTVIDDELSLKSWLCNTPLYLQLQWFDTVENVDVSVKLKRRRWTSEITARDALYLEKLGVILS